MGALREMTPEEPRGELPRMRTVELPPEYSRAGIAERLELTRLALGLKRSQIARSIGINQSLWNAWVDREQLPNLWDMMRLCEKHELSLDWIYRDKINRLPAELAEQITKLREGR